MLYIAWILACISYLVSSYTSIVLLIPPCSLCICQKWCVIGIIITYSCSILIGKPQLIRYLILFPLTGAFLAFTTIAKEYFYSTCCSINSPLSYLSLIVFLIITILSWIGTTHFSSKSRIL